MKLKHTPPRLSIVMKVSMLVASMTAITALLVGTIIIGGSSDIIFQDALSRLKYETNIKSINIVSDIKNLRGDAQYLAATPPILGIPRAIENDGIDPIGKSDLHEWQLRLETIFSELIRAKSNYIQIRYIGIADGGREIIRVERSRNIIEKVESKKLQKKGDTLYFKEAIKLHPGEVYLSDVTLNREHGKISYPHTAVIRAATPIYFNKKPFGILIINMSFNDIFNEMIKNTPRELIPYVTNEKGYFLAHPDNKKTYGFDRGNEHTIQSVYKDFKFKRNNDLRDTEYIVEANSDVIHVTKAFYDPSNKERFFAVMLATSSENLQDKSNKLREKSFIMMALLIIVSLIIAATLASRLMRPLQLITIAADDLAHGREVTNLPTELKDEIGDLAHSFENMYVQLEEKENQLIVSQGQVHHANKMSSLGEMASGMAHEINSPIQTISLIAQRVQRQLKKDISKEDINTSMEKITSSVNKISEIIDSLRNVSRTSTGDNFQNEKLKFIIQDVINMTEERFKVNNVHFEVNYSDLTEETLIQCQRLQLSQVLINLVNNAYDSIKNREEKWIKIDFKMIPDKVQISVTDSGTGIPENIVAKIFEPMFTTKEIGKGTGLGLSISNEIIVKHHGQFYVDQESANTRFVIELPIVISKHNTQEK